MTERTGISEYHSTNYAVAEYDPAFVDPGHGHSRPAWISIVFMLAAIAAGTVFFYLDQPLYVWICAGLTFVGAMLWPILQRAGVGAGASGH